MTVDRDDSVLKAVAVIDGRLILTGSSEEVRALIGDRMRVVDLKGRTVLPGIIDRHTHSSHLASRLLEIDFTAPPVRSIAEILDMLHEKAAELCPVRWVKGANFNDSKLEERRHIKRRELDEASPDNPVYKVSDTGHQCLVNSEALRIAGVTRDTPDPPGGRSRGARTGKRLASSTRPHRLSCLGRSLLICRRAEGVLPPGDKPVRQVGGHLHPRRQRPRDWNQGVQAAAARG